MDGLVHGVTKSRTRLSDGGGGGAWQSSERPCLEATSVPSAYISLAEARHMVAQELNRAD